MTSTARLYHSQSSPVRPRSESAYDERRRQPDVWACLRDPAGREHFIRRGNETRDLIAVLTGDVYGWREVRG